MGGTGTLAIFLISISMVLGLILFVIGIWEMFMYINYSWAKRDNENGYTGMDVAPKYLENLGNGDTKVKKAFFRMSYVRYNKSSDTMKLGVFDSKRKSIWTMASVAKQTLAAHVIKNGKDDKFNISPFWFRIQSYLSQLLISFASMFVTIIFIIGVINSSTIEIVGSMIVLSVLMLVPIYAFWKTSKVVYEHSKDILGDVISEDEREKLKKLWKIEYIHATVLLIKTIVDIVLNILLWIMLTKD